ncbi:MAG TPA: NADH-quinone oxidoreductase subunit M [Vicinamibacterales bacterium]|jgi:NADH-quinone oxidoreductase subunit M
MTLVALLLIPFVAGLVAWGLGDRRARAVRWVTLAAVVADFFIGLAIWVGHASEVAIAPHAPWILEVNAAWIPELGIRFHLAIDGLSLVLIMLTALLGVMSVLCSWTEITERVGFFHANILWVLTGIIGVFLAVDLFLFYFAWEVMLVPMYFLIVIWGHEDRVYAAIKFFIFTQLSGLLMLVAILALYVMHGRATGTYTFEYAALLNTPMSPTAEMWVMLGFFAAFAVKLPVFPFHTWLPDAHTEAPTAGSVILAGLMLKTGGYGFIRFVVPLFPHAAYRFAPVAMILGVIGILYGAFVAFSQTDLKRLVAYTSVSHLGFVLLGVFAWNALALQGAVLQMVCHGISTGALFILVGAFQERMHTRDLGRMGGLWAAAPRLSGMTLFFALASLGLPGLGDFIGEFLVMLGTFRVDRVLTVFAAIGILFATFYALRMVQRALHGANVHNWTISDLMPREWLILGVLVFSLIFLGLHPQSIFRVSGPALDRIQAVVPFTGATVQAAPTDARVPGGASR